MVGASGPDPETLGFGMPARRFLAGTTDLLVPPALSRSKGTRFQAGLRSMNSCCSPVLPVESDNRRL